MTPPNRYLRAARRSKERSDTIIKSNLELVATIRSAMTWIPDANAPCHAGIVPQARCGICLRIRAAHEALDVLAARLSIGASND